MPSPFRQNGTGSTEIVEMFSSHDSSLESVSSNIFPMQANPKIPSRERVTLVPGAQLTLEGRKTK